MSITVVAPVSAVLTAIWEEFSRETLSQEGKERSFMEASEHGRALSRIFQRIQIQIQTLKCAQYSFSSPVSVLAEDAIKAALSDYRIKQKKEEQGVKASG